MPTFSSTSQLHLVNKHTNLCFICSDTTQSNPNSKEFWVNMPNLMAHLKKVAEQKPQATYYNVDMLKYQVIQLPLTVLKTLYMMCNRILILLPHCAAQPIRSQPTGIQSVDMQC